MTSVAGQWTALGVVCALSHIYMPHVCVADQDGFVEDSHNLVLHFPQ